MSDIESVLKHIGAQMNQWGEHELEPEELEALIDCARALALLHADLGGHRRQCGKTHISDPNCTCGADALKRLGEL